ncbi:MAG: EAL domain-containing protein, partial [Acidimicrobiales bacterium]|nr:EAL domain-containing protein [Acidimicrobiales bacterium]
LKIDRSFVVNAVTEPEDAAIVTSTIDLAHRLGLRVVAEGVENADTVAWLASIGCDAFQGYFLTRPLPADAFGRWLTDHDTARFPA